MSHSRLPTRAWLWTSAVFPCLLNMISQARDACQQATAHLLRRGDIPHEHQAIIATSQHMKVVSGKAGHMDWRLVALELPQQRAAASIEHLHGMCRRHGFGRSQRFQSRAKLHKAVFGAQKKDMQHRQAQPPLADSESKPAPNPHPAHLHNRVLATSCNQPAVLAKGAAVRLVLEPRELPLSC